MAEARVAAEVSALRSFTRVFVLAAAGVITTAATGVLAAGGTRAAVPHPSAPTIALTNATPPCPPSSGQVGGALPAPPAIYTWTVPSGPGAPHAFTLNVLQRLRTAPPPSPTPAPLYCYIVGLASPRYVEAPTIYVYQGDTFTMTLSDRIPPAIGPRPSPTPQAYAPDRCALLNYESSGLPSPGPAGYLGRPRIVSRMSPGDMIANDTNFHTHGWHVDPDVDNVFKSVAQTANGDCVFRFAVPLNQPPGSYWYHAHLHGLAEQQVGGGLAGALVVVPKIVGPQLPDTVLLVKNYNGPPQALRRQIEQRRRNGPPPTLLGAANAVPAASPSVDPFNPPPNVSGDKFPGPVPPAPTECKTVANDSLAVNGIPIPVAASDAALARVATVPYVNQPPGGPGMVYRVVNASSDSYLNVRMIDTAGAYRPLTVTGRDGVPVNWDLDTGRVDPSKPDAVTRNNVFLGPSNRVDVFVPAGFNGTIIGAQAKAPFCIGYLSFTGLPSRGIVAIRARNAALRASAAPGAAAGRAARPRVSATTPTFADVFARNAPVTGQHRAITFTDYDDGTFYVTETGSSPQPLPTPWVEHPFWLRPAVAPPAPSPLPPGSRYQADIWVKQLPKPQQTVEVWNIYNATGEAHTFHIHQLTFVALQSGYEPADAQRVFLDSIALPGATVTAPPPGAPSPSPLYPYLQPSLTQIKIDFSHVDKGTFVFHCHMLFHEDAGMMGVIHLY